MGIKNFFRKQLSTVIEWENQSTTTLFAKANVPSSEIKNASKVIVSPGQGCILVYEGKVQDVLCDEGTYHIESDNHPFITSVLKLRQSFESEHKMHIYFFRRADIVNQHWGTASPIKYLDPAYKFPIQLGAFGNYSVNIDDAKTVFTNLLGSKAYFTTEDLRDIIVSRIVTDIKNTLANSKLSYNEIDSHLVEISDKCRELLADDIKKLGFNLLDFRIEGTIFDEETNDRISKIADMTTEALSAAEVGLNYVELEKLRALRDAARNEGGLSGAGLQVGAGLELSKSLVDKKEEIINDSKSEDAVEQLKKLKFLLDEEIITQEEFDAKKKEILARI